MMNGNCHCGAINFTFQGRPERLVACNCSICQRLRALWAHGPEGKIQITKGADHTITYVWGDRLLAFHSCKTCGCTTHWKGLGAENPENMAVNMAMCDAAKIRDIPVRQFDGADTWTYFD